MTITELIKELEKLKSDFGEKEVCIYTNNKSFPIVQGALLTPKLGEPHIILFYDNN